VVLTIVPEVPVIVIVYVPGTAVPVTMDIVEAQVPALGLQDAGLSVIVAPAGGADLVSATAAEEVPAAFVTVIVEFGGLMPGSTEPELGEADKEKLNRQTSLVVT